jgi:protein-tyrosine phosphatase
MPEVLDWQQLADPREVVAHCLRLLAQGKRIGLPIDGGLQILSTLPAAADPVCAPCTLLVADFDEALAWVPELPPLARRLGRRSWPGPLTLAVDADANAGRLARLDMQTRQLLIPEGVLHLRVPDHELLQELLALHGGPLLAESARGTAEKDACGGQLALVLRDAARYAERAPTVVRVTGTAWRLMRAGALAEADLHQRSRCRIVFVCTGNTCRSPMAEALCKKLLADRLGCTPAELPARGFEICSAGLAAVPGNAASPEAVQVAEHLGADLSRHASQPVTGELVYEADHVLTMTRSHLQVLETIQAAGGPAPRLLSAEGMDISDPIGGDLYEYRACADQIHQALQAFLPTLTSNGDLPNHGRE